MAAAIHPDFLRLALRLMAIAVAAFFATTLVMPLDTVGDPAFDIPMLRARWFTGFGIVWLHLALVLGLIWRMIRLPSLLTAMGLACLATALVLMLVEEGQLIRHGSLILPHEAAQFRLNFNRVMTALLALVGLIAVWRLDARG